MAQECRRDAGATTQRALFSALNRAHSLRSSPTKYFSGVHRFFVSQFWNFFLTSGAHTRKRTLASLRWIGSLLRGENGSRSACANRPQQGNATHRGWSKKRFQTGRSHPWPPFLFCLPAVRKIVFETRAARSAIGRVPYSSPEALAAAPCSRAGQMDS
jgi:hypothetical protein